MTTPDTLTLAEAFDLLGLGHARRTAEGALLLPHGLYYWNATRACYERRATPPSTGPVATTTMLRRMGFVLVGIGGAGTLASLLWFLQLWGRLADTKPEIQHCLWRWDQTCDMLAAATQLQGHTPYTPTVLWWGVGVLLVGQLLRICTQPGHAGSVR